MGRSLLFATESVGLRREAGRSAAGHGRADRNVADRFRELHKKPGSLRTDQSEPRARRGGVQHRFDADVFRQWPQTEGRVGAFRLRPRYRSAVEMRWFRTGFSIFALDWTSAMRRRVAHARAAGAVGPHIPAPTAHPARR